MAVLGSKIWLVTYNGVPVRCAWGEVAKPSEVVGDNTGFSRSALTSAQEADPGYEAVETAWLAVPPLMAPGLIDHPSSGASYSNGILTIAGCEWDVTRPSRVRVSDSKHLTADATVADIDALCAFAETVNVDLEVNEVAADIYYSVAVTPTEPQAENRFIRGNDVAIYRQTSNSTVVRTVNNG